MRLLLDENLPVKLKYRFIENGFDAYTLRDMKWLGKKNGDLIQLMIEYHFTTLITIDNNLSFQQNFKNYPLQVAVIIAKNNTYDTIMDVFNEIIEVLNQKFEGTVVVIHPNYY
jgi:predicted nuclease of predicted toxin-antitoxin system